MGFRRLAKAVAISVAVPTAVHVGRAAVGVLRAVAGGRGDISDGKVAVRGRFAVFSVLVSAYATFSGRGAASLFVGGFWRRMFGRWGRNEGGRGSFRSIAAPG